MTHHDLSELLRDRVADVTTTDLTQDAWATGRSRRRRRLALSVGAVATAVVLVAVGAAVIGDQGRGSTGALGPAAPGPVVADGETFRGVPVVFAPTPEQEATLPPASDVGLAAHIDLSGASTPAEEDPEPTVQGAFALTKPDGRTEVRLVAPDGTLRSLDLGAAGAVTPTESMVSPLGDLIAFPGHGYVAVYDVREARWHRIDTGGVDTRNLTWEGEDVLLDPRPYRGPGEVCEVAAGTCDYASNAYPSPRFGRYGAARPYGRAVPLPGSGAVGQVVAWTGAAIPVPGGATTASDFLDIGYGRVLLAMSGPRGSGCCPAATTLSDGRIAYSSNDAEHHRLISWRVGTNRFEVATDVTGVPAGTSLVSSYPRFD